MMRRANRTTSTDDADVAAGEAAAAAAAAAASAMTSAASHFLSNGGGGGSSTNSPIPSYASPLRHNAGAPLRQQHSHMSDQVMNDGGGAGGPKGASSSADDFYLSSAPASSNSLFHKAGSDLDFFEDHISDPVLVLGFDISHLSRQAQFLVCASGVFWFSLLYGYLQELISVQLCNRRLGLFLATAQFTGYTVLAYFLREFVYTKEQRQTGVSGGGGAGGGVVGMFRGTSRSPVRGIRKTLPASVGNGSGAAAAGGAPMLRMGHTSVPFLLYLGLSLLRAVDLGMTNLAMQYINYPAKTLMKSSRVVFTMLFGVIISRKSYGWKDYAIVVCMCVGLALFMHADATSSAVFHHMGVIMLIVSLVCDGAITNMSESIMKQFGVGQDEVRCGPWPCCSKLTQCRFSPFSNTSVVL
jgi:UAA transporter family